MQHSSGLHVQNLTFSLGDKTIIDNVCFDVPMNQRVALVGLNGAGKSSLMRLLTGEVITSKGSIHIQQMLPTDLQYKDQLGYLNSSMSSLPGISSIDYLRLCCVLKARLRKNFDQFIDSVVEQWHLKNVKQPISSLSQGNLQKLLIAQAFLGQPNYIILDEPTQALDPVEQQRFIDNLLQLEDFKLCLFSSHHVSETVQAADFVLLLHHGKLVARLNLKNENEYWFVSELSVKQIESQTAFQQINLAYSQGNQCLYSTQFESENAWEAFSQLLLNKNLANMILGKAKNALMPLFSLLANQEL